jgi:sugar/nucleoside kinase (ribokinase family)
MILGLAYMDNYEKILPVSNIKNKINKNIIIDLNLHHRNIKSLITKYHYKNNICVCGTSSHKVYKIRDSLNKINVLILNKQESLNLTNKKSIKEALQNIIEQNKNLIIVITNGRNTVFAYHDNMIYSCKPLKVKIKNENGAGDVMSALFNYYLLKLKKFNEVLAKSVTAGGLQVSGYQSEKKTYLQKIDHMSKNIKVKVSKYNG